ncbi:TPA: AAC(6')-Ia family aminoglycoside 6'-N-acetyltransferase [Pseudomonas aeruginosa]|nr:AAC(6')-Ia family aminoglycoside 6'-N-acetyltransferase [Pseudomonas aeruginosa]
MAYEFCEIGESNEYIILAARILTKSFLDIGNNSWPDMKSATKEVEECIEKPNICLGIHENEKLLGWIGLRPMYKLTWELHPLVISTQYQNKGSGRLLINELEKKAKQIGIIGIVLGTDDEYFKTSLSAVDLYGENILDEIRTIKNIKNHPYEFYQKCGYSIVGVIPDANGKRKPDIWMWKKIND